MSPTPTIALVGCLDTKGDELHYLESVIESRGARAHVIDTGILGHADLAPATTAAEVACAADADLDELRSRADRGEAVKTMARGAARIVRRLFEEQAIQGILGAGGSANSTIASAAMQVLPVGFPKLMVSTVASGDTSPFVGIKDIAMMFSVSDLLGVNSFTGRILANAAGAAYGMALAEGRVESDRGDRPLIAMKMPKRPSTTG